MFIQKEIEKILSEILKTKYNIEKINFSVELQKNEKFGDYSSNIAFLLSKKLNKKTREIAMEIKDALDKKNLDLINRIEIAGGGFINIFINKNIFIDLFLRDKPQRKNKTKNRQIIIDYSSPNIAKPMHIGNLRATILGDFLSNLNKFLGYKVIRWNHIGDWGTQFGKLIVAYRLWGNKTKILKNPVDELLSLYVRFHKESKNNDSLNDLAREEFRKLELGDKYNSKILKWFSKISKKSFSDLYKLLEIKFEVIKGESSYIKSSKELIDELLKTGIASKSEGATIIDLKEYNLPPALIEKSDGSTLYLTRDIALLKYRSKKYRPSKILYVVGNEQSLNFQQLEAIKDILNKQLTDKNKLPNFEHIAFGLVLGPDGKKLSTRNSKIVRATDIEKDFVSLAQKITTEKHKKLSKKKIDLISKIIGIGAMKYSMLKEDKASNIKLNLNEELSLKNNSALYIQYTRARLMSIIKKAKLTSVLNKFRFLKKKYSKNNFTETEISLIKYMLSFYDVLDKCRKESSSHYLTEYLFTLANKINSFYESSPILKSKTDTKNVRLLIIKRAEKIIKTGLGIMGIKSPDSI